MSRILLAGFLAGCLLLPLHAQEEAQQLKTVVRRNYDKLQVALRKIVEHRRWRKSKKQRVVSRAKLLELRSAFIDENESKIRGPADRMLIGRVCHKIRRYGPAASHFGKAYKGFPEGDASADAGYSQIIALERLMQYDEVLALSEKLTRRYPDYHRQLVQSYARIKRARAKGSLLGFRAPPLVADKRIGVDGEFALSNYRGKVVVLFFFGSYDAACRQTMQRLNELQAGRPQQVAVLGVTTYYSVVHVNGRNVTAAREEQEFGLLKKFHAEQKMAFPILIVQPKLLEAYKVRMTPYLVILDTNGVARHEKEYPLDWKKVTEATERLRTEQLPDSGK